MKKLEITDKLIFAYMTENSILFFNDGSWEVGDSGSHPMGNDWVSISGLEMDFDKE